MSKTKSPEIPGGEIRHALPIKQKHIPWEVSLISLLLLAIQSRDTRILWFEQEDQRKALELDWLYKEVDWLRHERGERRRAA